MSKIFNQSKKVIIENAILGTKYTDAKEAPSVRKKDFDIKEDYISFSVSIKHNFKTKTGEYSSVPEYIKCMIYAKNGAIRDRFLSNQKYLESEKMPLLNIEGREKRSKYTLEDGVERERIVVYVDNFEINKSLDENQAVELEDDNIPF